MEIISSFELNRNDWEEFIKTHPAGNIFQSPDIFDLYKSIPFYEPAIIAVCDEKKQVAGILLSVVLRQTGGFMGRFSARSIIIGGPLIINNDLAIAQVILAEYEKTIRDKAIYSQIRNLEDLSYLSDCLNEFGYISENHLNVLIDISKDSVLLKDELHKERKRNISIAEKKGIIFREILNQEEIQSAIELIIQTYKKKKLPLAPPSFFKNAKSILGENVKFFGGFLKDKLLATRVVLSSRNTIFDWYSAFDHDYRNTYANDYLTWSIIMWAKENGYQTYDFGGAGTPGTPYGVRDYKLKFGGTLVNYGRFEMVHNKLLMRLGKIGMKLYKIL